MGATATSWSYLFLSSFLKSLHLGSEWTKVDKKVKRCNVFLNIHLRGDEEPAADGGRKAERQEGNQESAVLEATGGKL